MSQTGIRFFTCPACRSCRDRELAFPCYCGKLMCVTCALEFVKILEKDVEGKESRELLFVELHQLRPGAVNKANDVRRIMNPGTIPLCPFCTLRPERRKFTDAELLGGALELFGTSKQELSDAMRASLAPIWKSHVSLASVALSNDKVCVSSSSPSKRKVAAHSSSSSSPNDNVVKRTCRVRSINKIKKH